MIPEYIYEISQKLNSAGFECYLVGGVVRNLLLQKPVKDFDLTTNALPEQIQELFPKSILTGAKFGTVIVVVEDNQNITQNIEITTYRLEKEYLGGRWPSEITFTDKLLDDLQRRDFTVNSMALLPSKDIIELINSNPINAKKIIQESKELIDPFNGQIDLENKILRAVGNPIDRLREDGLRSVRACRLASVYDFDIEKETFESITQTLDIVSQVSMERFRDEFLKLIYDSPKPSVGIELMRTSGLLEIFIPELLEGYGMYQNQYHADDVYYHLMRSVDIAPKEIRIAALFHDIGKARTKEGEKFYGHDRVGAEMTKNILKRLKFSNLEIQDITNIIRWHMFFLPKVDLNDKQKSELLNIDIGSPNYSKKILHEKELRNYQISTGLSDKAIRRLIMRVGGHDQMDKLIKLRIADSSSNPKSSFDPSAIRALALQVAKIREEDSALSIKDLKINGNDLLDLGFEQGPEISNILEYLLDKVIDDTELNTKEKLIELSKQFKK